ncbi:MAG: divalent metal cation transporter [Pirellulaceae bacterium]|jgi:manganese transport protein|nr:divalent metal cation transporter [Pirellulaceae bacterium]
MENKKKGSLLSLWYLIGPAIIVASVVLGPGSIVTSSKVGCAHGYQLLWVLGLSGILMMATVMLSGWIGVSYDDSFCTEIANRLGRPVAVIVGLTVFGIVACFQSSNNLAILLAVEPFFPDEKIPIGMKIGILLGLNGLLVGVLYGARKLYRPIERLMFFMVMVMLVGFATNFIFARVSLLDVFAGLIPSFPNGFFENGFLPFEATAVGVDGGESIKFVDPMGAIQGMIATTFSVAGALYQAYLVKEKGWSLANIRNGSIDSIFGIAILAGISALILCTAAAQLHGTIKPAELTSASEVARQLKPLFGSFAYVLFCGGIFAGAFSSFLVNAMIGGSVMADGLGKSGGVDSPWTKALTIVALAFGMGVAILATCFGGDSTIGVIIFAQALTVIGNPGLAMAILYLAHLAKRDGKPIPNWLFVVAYVGLVLVSVLAVRTGWGIWLKLT